MPKKKKKGSGGGIPEWVVTYGDMMSLLLCFFILLAAFSELKREVEYQRVITAVKEAFGFSGGVGVMPTDDPPLRSMIEVLETLAMKNRERNVMSDGEAQSVRGKDTRVTKLRDGTMFTIGGALTFEPGSATLKPEAKTELLRVAKMLRGRRNMIDVRGHTASKILPSSSPYGDLMDLSYARAKAVADFLAREGNIARELLAIQARGDLEPVNARQYDEQDRTANRRVEIVMREIMYEEMSPEAGFTAPGPMPGGGETR